VIQLDTLFDILNAFVYATHNFLNIVHNVFHVWFWFQSEKEKEIEKESEEKKEEKEEKK
jgi:hypothetical protein